MAIGNTLYSNVLANEIYLFSTEPLLFWRFGKEPKNRFFMISMLGWGTNYVRSGNSGILIPLGNIDGGPEIFHEEALNIF